jgi:hypothetical protein
VPPVKGKRRFQPSRRYDHLESVLREFPNEWIFVTMNVRERANMQRDLDNRLGAGDVVLRQRTGRLYAIFLTLPTVFENEVVFQFG